LVLFRPIAGLQLVLYSFLLNIYSFYFSSRESSIYSQCGLIDMKELKNDLIIKFSGRLDNLLIKHKGMIILNYNGNPDLPEERSPGYLKNQGKMGVTSSFAKAVNSIPILKDIWHKSYFRKSAKTRFKVAPYKRTKPGKAISFNKIVAANNKFSGEEHPTINNIIIPRFTYRIYDIRSCFEKARN